MPWTTRLTTEIALLAIAVAMRRWREERAAAAQAGSDTPGEAGGTDPTGEPAAGEQAEAVEIETFLRGYRSGLARYQEIRKDRLVIRGTLFDVSSLNPQTAWIGIRHIDGLERTELVTESIERRSAAAEEELEAIGKNGAITLEGVARTTPERLAVLRMDDVRRINGQPIR